MKRLSLIFLFSAFCFYGCSKEEVFEELLTPEIPSEPALVKGKFLDSPVEGLIYRTATQEGTTTSNGEFQFMEGEKVSFFVGEIKIGEAIGKEILTPIDIAAISNATINSLEVKNIAAFLQTLDADKNPENGIKISSKAVSALPEEQIDFSKHFIQLLGELVAEINQKALMNLRVVFPEVAAAHLAQSLELDYEISGLEAGAFFDIIEKWDTKGRNVNWIHKFNSEGEIIESMAFQKFPWRPLLNYIYDDYNSNGYPRHFEGHYLRDDGSNAWYLNFYLEYGADSDVRTYAFSPASNPDPNFAVWEIKELDDQRRVIEYSGLSSSGKATLDYDDSKNSVKESLFDAGMNEPKSTTEYIYNEFGSLKTRNNYVNGSLIRTTNNFYGELYTIEKKEIIEYQNSQEVIREVNFYNENLGRYRYEKYLEGDLVELYERNEEGSKTTIYNREDGSFYIEYRDANNQKYKTEYYGSDGNLLSTEEY